MKENKPIQNEEEVKPPNNPQDAVHEQLLNSPSTNDSIVHAAETTPEVEQPQTTNYKLKKWKFITTPIPVTIKKSGQIISGNF